MERKYIKGMVVLTPSEGCWLTEKDVNEYERVFSDEVTAPDDESADKWREASDDEKNTWELQHNMLPMD